MYNVTALTVVVKLNDRAQFGDTDEVRIWGLC